MRSHLAIIKGGINNIFKDQLKQKFSNVIAFGIIQLDIVQYHVKTSRMYGGYCSVLRNLSGKCVYCNS